MSTNPKGTEKRIGKAQRGTRELSLGDGVPGRHEPSSGLDPWLRRGTISCSSVQEVREDRYEQVLATACLVVIYGAHVWLLFWKLLQL